MRTVDWLILTAANEAQARGYRAQLALRQKQGELAHVTQWDVIADPGGRRVGSGGSTLWVLHEIARQRLEAGAKARDLAGLFADQRVLIVHSGGDSRRLCAYAAQGKIFTPLPCDTQQGSPATLFDLILDTLLRLPAPADGQVLIAAGDVLPLFHRSEIDFTRAGVTGVAFPGPIERGSRHGVYVADRQGVVSDFLQKPDAATAEARQAVDAVGRVLIDTGLLSLDPATVARWLKAAGVKLTRGKLGKSPGLLKDVLAGTAPAVDLYEQLLMALPSETSEAAYLDAVAARAKPAWRKRLAAWHRAMRGCPFHVNVLPWCEFFHIGTTRELLTNVGSLNRTAKLYHFENLDRSVVTPGAGLDGAFVYNSMLESPQIRAGEGVVLEACHVRGPIELPGGNVVVGWPANTTRKLSLPRGVGLTCMPVGSAKPGHWAVVLFGVDDDFKTSRAAGGTFLGETLDALLTRHSLAAADVWDTQDAGQQTLWNAKLWTVGKIDDVLRDTLWLAAPRKAAGEKLERWRKAKRVSMAELLGRVAHDRLIAHRAHIQHLGELFNLDARLREDAWLSAQRVADSVQDVEEAKLALWRLAPLADGPGDPLLRARVLRMADAVVQRFPAAAPKAKLSSLGQDRAALATAAIAQAVARDVPLPTEPRQAAVLPDQAVWVTTPVRIDFAGGWTDTPPICTEMGGAVVNAAVKLNGQYPVQVVAKRADELRLTVSSIDLGQRVVFTRTQQVLAYTDPTDWAALPKAALVLAGIAPSDPNQKLEDWLNVLGGGLDLTVFSALPKGSGLGTSSVLGAAALACLARVVGESLSPEQLVARTSVLEQMMTTAGGWQDQVGGAMPGVKLIRTQPGPDQTPSLHWIAFNPSSDHDLSHRMVLYYTGIRRMARNILQQVVWRYLARDSSMRSILDELKAGAEQMKEDLDRGDTDRFATGVERYWTLKKRIDPGSTNPRIEALIERVRPLTAGLTLTGAGGGGFLCLIARDAAAADRLRRTLRDEPPNAHARVFDFQVDTTGLAVTVL